MKASPHTRLLNRVPFIGRSSFFRKRSGSGWFTSASLWLTALLVFGGASVPPAAGESPSKVVATIPFDYQNDFIIVEVVLNGFLPLKFIFDTGAENTIITKREVTDMLGVVYEREIKVVGADLSQELTAYLVRDLNLDIADLSLKHHPLLVFEEDYFHFQEFTGQFIHGILGANIFRHYLVRIDYQQQEILLYRPQDAPGELRSFESMPIEIFRSKPYLLLDIRSPEGKTIELKLLMDTGASLSLLLHTNRHPDLKTPERTIPGNIGRGLGGFLEGFIGKIEQVQVGPFLLRDIPSNFQQLPETMDSTFLNDRHGILGNGILSRFQVAIDFVNETLYLKPNRSFDKKFRIDRSGISLIAGGENLQQQIVYFLVPDSPAARAGLRPGDRLTVINGLPAGWLELEQVAHLFSKKKGKKIKLTVRRGAGKETEKLKFRFYLEDLL